MYSESFAKSVNYKLRELELIIRQLGTGEDPAGIDIDLALDKTRELYDILLRLKAGRFGAPPSKAEAEPAKKSVVPTDPEPVERERVFQAEGVIPDPVYRQEEKTRPEDTESREPLQSAQPEKEKPEGPEPLQSAQPEKEKPEGPEPLQSAQPAKDRDQKKAPGSKETNEIEIVADRYQTSQNYINKAMADRQSKKDISSKQQSKPISDLRNSIGLNEKFLFIKELFKGRPEQYNQCIDELNRSASFEGAISYIKENYSWEEDSEVYEKLVNLLKRKHQAE